MTPHTQKFIHDPANGVWGDCARTCIASILDLPVDEVPHFFDNGVTDDGHVAMREFLAERHYRRLSIPFPGEVPLDELLMTMRATNPGGHYMLVGRSRNDTNHVVICKDGKIVHDPSIDQSGIVGPCDDGYWWIEFIGADV